MFHSKHVNVSPTCLCDDRRKGRWEELPRYITLQNLGQPHYIKMCNNKWKTKARSTTHWPLGLSTRHLREPTEEKRTHSSKSGSLPWLHNRVPGELSELPPPPPWVWGLFKSSPGYSNVWPPLRITCSKAYRWLGSSSECIHTQKKNYIFFKETFKVF